MMLELGRAAPVTAEDLPISRQRLFLLTLTLTCSLGMLSSTIYVPSIPAIVSALCQFANDVRRISLGFCRKHGLNTVRLQILLLLRSALPSAAGFPRKHGRGVYE
jgi:hypothetical protein